MKPIPYWIKHLTGSLLFLSLLFIGAGTFDYFPGIMYVALALVMFVLNYTVLRIDPSLAQERGKPGEGAKTWDKKILGFSFLGTLLMYITAGLDSGRYHWSPEFPTGLVVAGFILTASGQLLFLIAQKQNSFFSSTVRIQQDREHTVCDTGLYRIVRHPGYLGSLLQTLGFPLFFSSLWSILPVAVLIFLLVLRTQLEDRTLEQELRGYSDYQQKTKNKLIPGIW